MTTSLVPTRSGGAASAEAPPVLARTSALAAPAIARAVDRLDPTLHDAVRHHLSGGGKRVRAGLVCVSAAVVGGSEEDGVPGAVAVELLHNYSLLHDDIVDGDRERRHLPTVWARFGEGVAIVAGDALAALATQVLLDDPTPARVDAARRLANANQDMIAGQSSDMAFEARASVTVEECLTMERGKTGALLSASCAIGAVLGGGHDDAVGALAAFGEHLGTAFQAVDDMLGIWGEPSVTGKPVGADLLARKKTLPVAVALDTGGESAKELEKLLAGTPDAREVARATALIEESGAREFVAAIADEHLRLGISALDRVDLVSSPKEDLVAIAHFVTARDR